MKEAATRAPLTAQNYKSSYKPIWCPGCGDYSVLSSVTKALAMVQVPPEDVVVVSGIGCSSRIPAYTTCYGFHGVHGRALAGVSQVLVVEQNHGAQLFRYLRAMYDLPGKPASYHRPGPLPLRPGELAAAILDWRRA